MADDILSASSRHRDSGMTNTAFLQHLDQRIAALQAQEQRTFAALRGALLRLEVLITALEFELKREPRQ
jgi:hypothetical protein